MSSGPWSVLRRYQAREMIDHVFIACLECRFGGSWSFTESRNLYIAKANGALVILVELNGTRKTIGFKKDAYVTLLPSNVITFEREDEDESVYVDEDEKRGKQKNATVL